MVNRTERMTLLQCRRMLYQSGKGYKRERTDKELIMEVERHEATPGVNVWKKS